jgi:hypothetical protein
MQLFMLYEALSFTPIKFIDPSHTTAIQAIPVGLVPTGFSPKPTGFSYSRRF